MTGLPTVDVVIPTRNLPRFVGSAVDSALHQRGVATRVIVVDDASEVPVTALDPGWPAERVTVIREDQQVGIAAALNRGMERVDADYIALLDADDLWPVHRCRELLDALVTHGADLAYGSQVIFDDGTEPILDAPQPPFEGEPALLSGASIITASAAARMGRFDESVKLGSFINWVVIGRHLDPPLRELPVHTVALLRRSHSANTTRTETADFGDYMKAVARHRRLLSEGNSP